MQRALPNEYFQFLVQAAKSWPENKEGLYRELDRAAEEVEESVFQEAIRAFIEYINRRTENPFKVKRFRSIHLFTDGYFNVSTDDFKELNAKLLSLLKVESTFTQAKSLFRSLLSGSASITHSMISYAVENPGKACLLLLALSIPSIKAVSQPYNTADVLNESNTEIRDVTHEIGNCSPNPEGKNLGQICSISGDTFFMKELPKQCNNKVNHPINTLFNQVFVKKLDVIVPRFEIQAVRIKNNPVKLFISSKKVTNFVLAKKIPTEQRMDLFKKNKNASNFAVIASFIFDLHVSNYGFADGKLVLVDIDHVPIKHLDEKTNLISLYQVGMSSFVKHVPPIFLKNIQEMKELYQELFSTPSPKFHHSLDMAESVYTTALKFYISLCDKILIARYTGPLNQYFAEQIYFELEKVQAAQSSENRMRTSL